MPPESRVTAETLVCATGMLHFDKEYENVYVHILNNAYWVISIMVWVLRILVSFHTHWMSAHFRVQIFARVLSVHCRPGQIVIA